MSPTEIVFWLVFLGGNIMAMFNPTYGVLLYILVYCLNPEMQWWGANVRLLELRTSFLVAMSTSIGLLINWQRLRRGESQFRLMYVLMLGFLLYCFLVSMTGLQPLGSEHSRPRIDKLMRICIFVFLMTRVIRDVVRFRWLMWSWMAGTIYIGYQAWGGVGGVESGRLSSRLGGSDFNQSSGLAAHMVAMTAMAGFLFFSSQTRRGKFFALLAAACAVNTIILTRTRNALPGLVFLVFFGIMRLPRGVRLKCGFGIAVGLVLAVQLTDQGWWERMATLRTPNQDLSITRRYDYWRAAVEMASEYPWGVGVGNFRNLVPDYVDGLQIGRSAHSTYFQCLAELGWPGLMLYLSVLAAAMYHFEYARRVGRVWVTLPKSRSSLAAELRELHLLATANEVGACGFLVSAAFTSRLWVEGLWVVLAMGCCLHNISVTLRARVREAEDAPKADAAPVPAMLIPTSGYY